MASVEGLMGPALGSAGFAIVGYAARFPGAADADEFWQVLAEGRDAVSEVPSDRVVVPAAADSLLGGMVHAQAICKRHGLLPGWPPAQG